MKRRSVYLSQYGILRSTTYGLITASTFLLSQCSKEDGKSMISEQEKQQLIERQKQWNELESMRKTVEKGELMNNFHLQGVGYYHAQARRFFEQPYQFKNDKNQYFVNGEWLDSPGNNDVAASVPLPEELKKVEDYLTKESQQVERQMTMQNQSSMNYHHSSGIGQFLLMSWLLNRNSQMGYQTSPGFQQTSWLTRKVDASRWRVKQDIESRMQMPVRQSAGSSSGSAPSYHSSSSGSSNARGWSSSSSSSSPSSVSSSSSSSSSRGGFGSTSSSSRS